MSCDWKIYLIYLNNLALKAESFKDVEENKKKQYEKSKNKHE